MNKLSPQATPISPPINSKNSASSSLVFYPSQIKTFLNHDVSSSDSHLLDSTREGSQPARKIKETKLNNLQTIFEDQGISENQKKMNRGKKIPPKLVKNRKAVSLQDLLENNSNPNLTILTPRENKSIPSDRELSPTPEDKQEKRTKNLSSIKRINLERKLKKCLLKALKKEEFFLIDVIEEKMNKVLGNSLSKKEEFLSSKIKARTIEELVKKELMNPIYKRLAYCYTILELWIEKNRRMLPLAYMFKAFLGDVLEARLKSHSKNLSAFLKICDTYLLTNEDSSEKILKLFLETMCGTKKKNKKKLFPCLTHWNDFSYITILNSINELGTVYEDIFSKKYLWNNNDNKEIMINSIPHENILRSFVAEGSIESIYSQIIVNNKSIKTTDLLKEKELQLHERREASLKCLFKRMIKQAYSIKKENILSSCAEQILFNDLSDEKAIKFAHLLKWTNISSKLIMRMFLITQLHTLAENNLILTEIPNSNLSLRQLYKEIMKRHIEPMIYCEFFINTQEKGEIQDEFYEDKVEAFSDYATLKIPFCIFPKAHLDQEDNNTPNRARPLALLEGEWTGTPYSDEKGEINWKGYFRVLNLQFTDFATMEDQNKILLAFDEIN